MNKNLFLTLSAFLFLFPLSGKATGTYRPETSVAGFIQLPGSGRQVYDFNPGWRFFKGDISGAETVNFDDRSWEVAIKKTVRKDVRGKPKKGVLRH